MPISILMSRIIQMGPKMKNAQDLLKFSKFDISNIPISILMSKIIFIKYLPPVRSRLVPKLKVLRIYWNLAQLIFRVSRSQFWCQRWFLWNVYQLLGPNWPQIGYKIKSTQNLLKFNTFHISNIPILNLVSKIIFIKFLPPVWPKVV